MLFLNSQYACKPPLDAIIFLANRINDSLPTEPLHMQKIVSTHLSYEAHCKSAPWLFLKLALPIPCYLCKLWAEIKGDKFQKLWLSLVWSLHNISYSKVPTFELNKNETKDAVFPIQQESDFNLFLRSAVQLSVRPSFHAPTHFLVPGFIYVSVCLFVCLLIYLFAFSRFVR